MMQWLICLFLGHQWQYYPMREWLPYQKRHHHRGWMQCLRCRTIAR